MKTLVLVVVLLGETPGAGLLASGAQGAQKPAARPADAKPAQTAPPPGDYLIGPQDVLTITVYEEPQLSGRYPVNNDGAFTFPMIGRVQAAGLSPRSLEERLTKLLADGYIRHPQLSVEVEQYRSQSITVTGEVRTPGRVALTGPMTVMDALVHAGSVTPNAAGEVQILRPKASGPGQPAGATEILRVSLADLQSGKLANNHALRDGDTVVVPRAEPFFVTGHVRTPGAYPVQRGMTVLQALSVAGGITDRGSERRIRIVRIVNGRKTEIDAKLTDLVQSGDTIVVPQRFF
jgi:polysaccharide export outer membrane protein